MSESAPSAPSPITRPTPAVPSTGAEPAARRPAGARAVPQPAPTSPSTTNSDWPVTVSDRIESVVGTVRDRTTLPLTKVARAIVFGLLALVAGITALILLVIAIVRLHVYLPFHPEGRRLWASYAVVGVIFMLVGALVWRKRTASRS